MSSSNLQATLPLLSEAELQRRWSLTLRSQLTQAMMDPGLSYRPADTLRETAAQAAPTAMTSGGPFAIIEELGRGGMGVVYRARQASLEREVALKTMLGESDLRARAAFLTEARVTGWLEHPNIVPVHGLELDPQSGQPYLSMKVVRGASWKELLHPETPEQKRRAAERKRPGDDLEILKAVCNALAFSHARGIAHLDLKPENVMVGEFGEVLVMDWGTALDIRDGPPTESWTRHKSELTSPCGTPLYMAPELANGEGQLCGPWTDVYLLGAMLYEVLTGRAPHSGKGLLQVICKAARGEPPAFTDRERRLIPEELRSICERAMAREPKDRYQSASNFRQALDDYLEHAESITLCIAAEKGLARVGERLRQKPVWTADRLAEVTSELAEAASGFRQALALWRENPRARRGAQAAQALYVRTALDNGNISLARAQAKLLDGSRADERDLHRAISRAEKLEKRQDHARAERTRLSWIAAVLSTTAALALGLLYWRARSSAESEGRASAARLRALEEKRQKLVAEVLTLKARRRQAASAIRDQAQRSARAPTQKPPKRAPTASAPTIALVGATLQTTEALAGDPVVIRLRIRNRDAVAHRVGDPSNRRSHALGVLTVSIAREDGRPFRTRNGRGGLLNRFRLLRKQVQIRDEPWSIGPGEELSEELAVSTGGHLPGAYRLRCELLVKGQKSRYELAVTLR